MAHKTGNEETEFKAVPESRTLCINCGVAGIPAANICQVCFNATASSSTVKTRRSVSIKSQEEMRSDRKTETADETIAVVKKEVNRCSGCRKKVGLTGIRCRCGELFCSAHRYSDRHDCSYDYKAAGRDAISRENPVVKAAKIDLLKLLFLIIFIFHFRFLFFKLSSLTVVVKEGLIIRVVKLQFKVIIYYLCLNVVNWPFILFFFFF